MLRKIFKNAGIPVALGVSLMAVSSASQAASYWQAGTFGTVGADGLATVQGMNVEYIPIMLPILLTLAIPKLVKGGIKGLFK